MPRSIKKSRLHSNKQKPKTKQGMNNTKSNLPPHLQSFKQKLLSGSGLLSINSFKFIRHGYIQLFECLYILIFINELILGYT